MIPALILLVLLAVAAGFTMVRLRRRLGRPTTAWHWALACVSSAVAGAAIWIRSHHGYLITGDKTMHFIIAAAVVLVVLHLMGGAHSHVKHRRHGLNPRLSYTWGYGWWGSLRLPGGFRLGHKL